MMYIDYLDLDCNFLVPAIKFEGRFEISNIIHSMNGFLQIFKYKIPLINNYYLALRSTKDSTNYYEFKVFIPLDLKTIDIIEKNRGSNKDLEMKLSINYLFSKVENNIVNSSFTRNLSCNYHMSENDWKTKIFKPLKNVEYLTFEIPYPTILNESNESNESNDSNKASGLTTILAKLSKIQEDYIIKNNLENLAELRQLFELLRIYVDKLESKMLDLSEEAFKNLKDLINTNYQYVSKFIHSVGKNKMEKLENSDKDDVSFLLITALNIVSMIANKQFRYTNFKNY